MSIFQRTKKEKKPAASTASAAPTATMLHGGYAKPLQGFFLVRRPYMSEKAHRIERHRAYVFLVNPSANKIMVKRYVEERYKVNVERVNITNIAPKAKQFRGHVNRTGGRKKAIVRVREGQRIEIS
ncbi:MAG: 50S ribosomal protein L23 [Candidatus Jorgensenbacteria bacterium]